MQPRLVALSGPLSGSIYLVEAAELTLGRQAANDVHLRDLAVSRHHCRLARGEGGFVLYDLDSRHGTFVNGVPVRERPLRSGDVIRVGGSLFLFLDRNAPADDGEPALPVLVDGGQGDVAAASTLHLSAAGDAARQLLAPLPVDSRTVRALEALLDIGASLHAEKAVAPLAAELLLQVFALVPAERAALLRFPAGGGAPEIVAAGERQKGLVPPFPLSRTVVERVARERVALLSHDALQAAGLAGAASLATERIRALACVPLTVAGELSGVLYADTRDPEARFDEVDLRLLQALAGIAALALANAERTAYLEEEGRRLEAVVDSDMVGENPRMRELGRVLARVAATDSTVLLRGESGTGKEVAARALHRGSPRAGKPFVAINCANFSDTLLESELFGHERGAFTGAVERKLGRLETAHGGTLFLDEVGEIPLQLQSKLLRVLEEREFERLGSTRPIRVDIRLIAATHRDLEKAIAAGAFRGDLFYRLNVIAIPLPPLRERGEDVDLLASHFAARCGARLGRRIVGFTPAARAALRHYSWPGNVRELANAVERAAVLGEGELIRREDLPETVLEAAPPSPPPHVSEDRTDSADGTPLPAVPYHDAVNDHKRRLLLAALAETQGHVTRAAGRLGLNPTYLHRLIKNLGVRLP